ncbi:hypothetical protein WMF30_10585 [Sorangium sp. So ce134]
MSEQREETVDEWANALEAWRREYWDTFRKSCDAWRKRGEDEQKARRLKKEHEAAAAAFASSDAEAQELQRRVDALRAAGHERGFST